MSLEKISEQLSGANEGKQKKLPPVELWNPPYCGEIDLQIKSNGDWFYNGTIFKRLSLVKLFASVLICEKNEQEIEEYFLVTPVEKVKITVEEVPFIITQWAWQGEQQRIMELRTNLDDTFMLSKEHPLQVSEKGDLYVTVRRNLVAKVHRNVYYQWVNFAKEITTEKGVALTIESAGEEFILGYLD